MKVIKNIIRFILLIVLIAVGILIATGNINNNLEEFLESTIFIGELSLNGKI